MTRLETAALAFADAVATQGAARVELHKSRERAKGFRLLTSLDVRRRQLAYHGATRARETAGLELWREAKRAVQ